MKYRKTLHYNSNPYQISRIYFLKGDFNSALDEINKELKLRPEIPNSYYVRGLILGYRGNFREAESDFFKFIKLIPSQWAGYNDLAWIQVKLKKFQDAKETILKSFKITAPATTGPAKGPLPASSTPAILV